MCGAYDDVAMALHRINALLGWWSISGTSGQHEIDSRISRFQRFASQLQEACDGSYVRQVEAALSAGDHLAQAFQDLARCRHAQEFVAAQSAILATLLDVASLEAKTWIELTQKLQQTCAAMAREATDDVLRQAPATPTGLPAKEEHRTATPAPAKRVYA